MRSPHGRYSSPSGPSGISFGPGPLSQTLKYLIGANVAIFLLLRLAPETIGLFGLSPRAVLGRLHVWQLATYMFLHGGLFHLLFNMLALWMFGTELERIWGSRAFVKYYMVTGVGAAVLTVLFSLLPIEAAAQLYGGVVIGASGAVYGLLLAFARRFPNVPILLFFLFPIPAKYFVMIIGALAFYSSVEGSGGGVANATHLFGLLVGYVYLRGVPLNPWAEVKYRYARWRINQLRKKFDVHQGGRVDRWDKHVH
jgi:membrane associated rhomboid family serine protease